MVTEEISMKKKSWLTLGIILAIVVLVSGWWVFQPAESSRIPIKWTAGDLPIIEATIDGKKCLLELSTSNKFLLSLDEHGLDFVTAKTPIGTAKWRDIRGNFYDSQTYLVKNLTIGTLIFQNIVTQIKNSHEGESGTIWTNPNLNKNSYPSVSGTIGRPVLEKTNLFLDLGHDLIIATNSKRALKEQGYSLDSMEKIPLEPDERGIVLRVDTNMGPLRLEINTSATLNVVRSSLVTSTSDKEKKIRKNDKGLSYFISDFTIGQTDFGAEDLFLIDMSDEMTWLDGFLGIDFLTKHLLYIDYQNKVVYIK
jgi:hypothetical protein